MPLPTNVQRASISSIQMRRRGTAEWGDNWLGQRASWIERDGTLPPPKVLQFVEEEVRKRWKPNLQPHWECIPKGMCRAFYRILPEGDGHYEFRVALEGTSQVIEASAFISSDHLNAYTWTPGKGSVEVGPVAHGAGSRLVSDVMIWVPDIGAIPLRLSPPGR